MNSILRHSRFFFTAFLLLNVVILLVLSSVAAADPLLAGQDLLGVVEQLFVPLELVVSLGRPLGLDVVEGSLIARLKFTKASSYRRLR